MLSMLEWNQRYQQQARWTSPVRRFLYQQAGIADLAKILEVGCGTGAILADLSDYSRAKTFGIDLLPDPLKFAREHAGLNRLANADGLNLPFADANFEACLCHFYLLWIPDPLSALQEMVRVTRKNGVILALAEPDYGGRIDYPEELSQLGLRQALSLKQQGADPRLGRKLRGLMHQAGCRNVTCGLMGGEWISIPAEEDWANEWQVLVNDLEASFSRSELQSLQALDRQAWQNGQRILYVPTFYAAGMV
jgi:ubiquinone/menaquinone biosynthesis C-methylase UbiE